MTDNLSPIRSRSWQRPEEKEEGKEDKEEVVGKQEEKRRPDLVVSVQMRLSQAIVLLKVLDSFNLDRIRPPTS